MPARLPDGDPAPPDGALPEPALAELGARGRPFGIYVHVPFCATRCGYCDFNTYTADELGGGRSRAGYVAAARAEIALARRVLGAAAPPAQTVFFGGGTPTLLAPDELGAILGAIEEAFGLAPDAEVTTEANPESVDARSLAALRAVGFTRVSLGMQSAAPHVLATLDRVHTPGRAVAAAHEARAAGFEHVSLDLIYGAPGESDDDWRASLEAALSAEPDHVSAYALTVEPGTRLSAQVRRGALPTPDDDTLADRYELADRVLGAAGLRWYEISNWAAMSAPPTDGAASGADTGAPAGDGGARAGDGGARAGDAGVRVGDVGARAGDAGARAGDGATRDNRCRHNLGYWRGGDWWGVGPGAHSHVGGVRWWNVLHPATYARRLAAGESPAAGRELLDADARRLERIMLELRLSDGLPLDVLDEHGRAAAAQAAADGLAEPDALTAPDPRVRLTLRGRLLADTVVRALTGP